MITATPAPKVVAPKWLVVPYAYAAVLVILAIATLMGIGRFDFAFFDYETPGSPELAITVAALQIFSLPFVLRLPLSPLARFVSATCALITPFFLLAVLAYLASQGVMTLHAITLLGAGLFALVGVISFGVLDGRKAMQLMPRGKR